VGGWGRTVSGELSMLEDAWIWQSVVEEWHFVSTHRVKPPDARHSRVGHHDN